MNPTNLKIRVNKGLYWRKNSPYTNANLEKSKKLLQAPIIDFEDVRRKIEFILHIPDLYQKLAGENEPERGLIIHSPVINALEELPEIVHTPILIIGAGFHDRKIVDDIIIQDLKMLLATMNDDMRKRALEVLNSKK